MIIQIKKINTLATIQDGGRFGYQSLGVPVCGPMDDEALGMANLLVGNARDAACLEIASGKMEILLHKSCTIALTGDGVEVLCNHQKIDFNKRIELPTGSLLKWTPIKHGYWSYLSISGGIITDPVLGSRSTYLSAHFGGQDGRALKVEDHIEISSRNLGNSNDNEDVNAPNWGLVTQHNLSPIKVIKGPEFNRLSEAGIAKLREPFTLSTDSNRMGYRLNGNKLEVTDSTELISTAVTRGTMQLTNDGTPIVLMADAQTIGGYPRIAQVAAVDIGRLAQKRPGETVQFEFISYDEACMLFLKREQEWIKTEASIRLKLNHAS